MSARREIVAAMRDGKAAAEAGEPLSTNPYDARSGDRTERLLATLWARAHNRVQPRPVDYGDRGSQ